jgi:hypothetical protein
VGDAVKVASRTKLNNQPEPAGRRLTSRPEMAIDAYLPGCNFRSIEWIAVEADAATVWVPLPDMPGKWTPKGLFAFMLWLASVVRRDLRRRGSDLVGRLTLSEGEVIGYGRGAWRIEHVEEGREVVLHGSHRYADFYTNLYLEAMEGGRTRVYNVTRAHFSQSLLAKVYLLGVRVCHGPAVNIGLRRLKKVVEARGHGASRTK